MKTQPFKVGLLPIAESIDTARINANSDDRTAPQAGVYGKLSEALKETLALMAGPARGKAMYELMIRNGDTVREARRATEPARPMREPIVGWE